MEELNCPNCEGSNWTIYGTPPDLLHDLTVELYAECNLCDTRMYLGVVFSAQILPIPTMGSEKDGT